MEFTFKIKYESGTSDFDGLDMYHGSHSLAAFSEFILLSTHVFIHEEIIVRAPAAKGFRVTLKKGNIGSYEQIIQFIVTDSETLSIVKDLGVSGLYDLFKYLLGSLLGIPYIIKNRKAKKKLRALTQQNDDLHDRLERALMTAHLPVKHQGYSIAMLLGRKPIVTFDETTLEYLETEEIEPDSQLIEVAVSRFNVRTGTGRFITEMDGISIGFSPTMDLDKVSIQLLASNLEKLASGKFEVIKALVTKVNSKDGSLKRYQLHDVIKL